MSVFEMLSIFLSVMALASALARAVYIFTLRVNAEEFVKQVIKLMEANNMDRTFKLCDAAPKAIFPQRMKKVLEAYAGGEKEKDKLRTVFYGSSKGAAQKKVVNLGFMKVNVEEDQSEFDRILYKMQKRFYSSIVALALAIVFYFVSPKSIEPLAVFFVITFLLIVQPTVVSMKIKSTAQTALEAFLERFGR